MTDTREYLPAFLADAREQLETLGLAVVRLETEPEDGATADQVFRIAHTLKGMSATMGFEAIAALTHAMEDVFELLRQRTDGLTHEAIDVLSACLDALEETVEGIARGGEEELDAAPLVTRLEALARVRTPEQELARVGGAALPDLARPVPDDGRRVVHVVAELVADAPMPGARAHMLLSALAAHGELLGSVPAPGGVERFSGRQVEAWLATHADDAAIEATAATVGDVVRALVRAASVEPAPAAPVPAAPTPAAAVEATTIAAEQRTSSTVRVEAERLDELLHLMGELVIQRTAVEALTADAAVPGLADAVQQLARTSQALQATITRVRMIPVDAAFARFPRLVRDLSGRLGKQVELRLTGRETELDRTVVDALGAPLVHLVRNALDHGLELPADRAAAGKPPVGTIELAARHAGGHVIVSVRDDGRGVDPAAIARVAQARGLIDADQAAALDLEQAVELLFAPGFSTAGATTDVSGRGVGMDAVRMTVRALGGDVTLASQAGAGTVARIRLPLTLASIAVLLVTVGGQPYAIPLERVERTLRLADQAIRSVAGAPMLVLEGEVLPLLDGDLTLGHGPSAEPHRHAIVVRGGGRLLALAVADLTGQRELVTRRLPREVSARAALAGGATLPDGGIALVVDCDALAVRGPDAPPAGDVRSVPDPLAVAS